MKTAWKLLLAGTLLLGAATSCFSQLNTQPANHLPTGGRENNSRPSKSVVYKNKAYRFRFYLPKSWKGYTIIEGKWGGGVYEGESCEPARFEEGPMITIRHPLWTKEYERQDIPVMALTRSQWNLILRGDLIVSAAGILPSEMGRNSKYVFALPARYNYADVIGIAEVSEIIGNHPLHAY
jgi:hypothetical protein